VFDWFNLVAHARKSMHFDIINSIDGLCNRLYAHKEYTNKELQLVMQVGNLHYERFHYIAKVPFNCLDEFLVQTKLANISDKSNYLISLTSTIEEKEIIILGLALIPKGLCI